MDIRNKRDARSKLAKMIREFDQVFNEDGKLRTMKCDPMRIHIKPDVKIVPLNLCTPRKTPMAYLDAVKAKIESDLALGIIKKVEGVSRWCSPTSFVPILNGKVSSVVDLVQLNKHVDRPTHPFPASKDIVSRIPTGSKCFRVFDCMHGYWQIPLAEESTGKITHNCSYVSEWYSNDVRSGGLLCPRKNTSLDLWYNSPDISLAKKAQG